MVPAGKKMSVTRNDVARACGVSGALVSYAFSATAHDKVKPETRDKILQTAREMGYRPSLIGRCLKKNCSYNICILLPERFVSAMSLHQLRIFHGVCMSMQETDYRPMIFFGVNDKLFKTLEENRVDGIILLDSALDLTYADKLVDYKLPMVFANVEYQCDLPHVASVRSDHEKLICDRLNDLISNHCKNILLVAGMPDTCQPNHILKEAFEKFAVRCDDSSITFRKFFPAQFEVNEAMQAEAESFFTGADACDGVLVDGGEFAKMIIEAACKQGIELEQGKNCFTSCSQEEFFPNWSHNSFLLGKQAWVSMQKLLKKEKTEKVKLVPYFHTLTSKELENSLMNSNQQSE